MQNAAVRPAETPTAAAQQRNGIFIYHGRVASGLQRQRRRSPTAPLELCWHTQVTYMIAVNALYLTAQRLSGSFVISLLSAFERAVIFFYFAAFTIIALFCVCFSFISVYKGPTRIGIFKIRGCIHVYTFFLSIHVLYLQCYEIPCSVYEELCCELMQTKAINGLFSCYIVVNDFIL